jgi:ABC-2 type transport system permease protein
MISKPLFKQPVKANRGIWCFVTIVICVMLAVIIAVLGNLDIDEIRGSLTDTFIKDSIECQVKEQSMTYFYMSENALTSYEKNVDNVTKIRDTYLYITTVDGDGNPENGNQSVLTEEQARYVMTMGKTTKETESINGIISLTTNSLTGFADSEVKAFVLNEVATEIYYQLLESDGEETANNAKLFISAAITSFTNQFLSTTEFATNYIPIVLQDAFYDRSFNYEGNIYHISDYLTKSDIKSTSYSSIMSFRAERDIKATQLIQEVAADDTIAIEDKEEAVATRLKEYLKILIVDLSESIVDSLPTKVADSLTELGNLDVYDLIVGSIFYKIAGLLLPIIYAIMVANNLVAGQVDTGSMAYILSTSTKRKKVMATQITFLISSLFLMFVLTTLTSIITLIIIGTETITISISELLLLNLGAFTTMFAISGICYLTSCIFNRSKQAMSYGGGLSMFFLVATILGLFGSKVIPSAIRINAMNYFNYFSIITLFDVPSILNGTLGFVWKLAILLVIGLATYIIGAINFDKKDLPL